MNAKGLLLAAGLCLGFSLSLHAEIANRLPHQGRVVVDGVNFDGTGQFKFLLYVDNELGPPAPVWSNAETQPTDLTEPSSAVSLTVTKGLYSIFLGDTGVPNMEALPESIEPPEDFFLYLRIWFDDGVHGFQQLSPDQLVGSAAFALHARSVTSGGVGSSALADGSVTEDHLADGAVSQNKLAAGAAAANIDAAGELGIGLEGAAPVAPLEVAGGAEFVSPEVVTVLRRDPDEFRALRGVGDILVEGDVGYAVSIFDSGLTIVDLSNPASPQLLSRLPRSADFRSRAAVSLSLAGSLLFVPGRSDDAVNIVDVTDPAAPVPLSVLRDGEGGFEGLDRAYSAVSDGDVLYVAGAEDDAISVIDISDPANPALIIELRDEVGGFDALEGVRYLLLSGSTLFATALDEDALNVIDVSDPSNPVLLTVVRDNQGGFDALDGALAMALDGGLLYVSAFYDDAVAIIDVSDASNPQPVSEIRNGVGGAKQLRGPWDLDVAGGLASINANEADAIVLVDVSDPTAPVVLRELVDGEAGFDALEHPIGTQIAQGLVFGTGARDDAITIFDPRLHTRARVGVVARERLGVGTETPGAALEVVGGSIISGTLRPGEVYADATGGMGVGIGPFGARAGLQLNSARGYIEQETLAIAKDNQNGFSRLFRPSSVALALPYAYVTSDVEHSLTLIDLSDPANPTLFREIVHGEGDFGALQGAADVVVEDRFPGISYIASRESDSLTIVRAARAGSPVLFAELVDGNDGFDDLDGAFRVQLHPTRSRTAFVLASEDEALSIVDATGLSDTIPRGVVKQGVDGVSSFSQLRDLAVGSETAYVASEGGLTIIDISDLDSPAVVEVIEEESSVIANLGIPQAVVLDGDTLYLATSTAIHALDVAQPQAPILLASMAQSSQFPGAAFTSPDQVLATGGRLFSVRENSAIGVVDVRNPGSPHRIGFIRTTSEGFFRPHRADVEGDLMVAIERTFGGELAVFDLSNFQQVDLIARNRVGIGTSTPRADLEVLGTIMGFQILDRTNSTGQIGDVLTSQGEFGNYIWTDSLDLTGTATVTGDITGRANIVAEGDVSSVNVSASGNMSAGGSVTATGAVTSDASLTAPAHQLPAAEDFAYNLAGNTLQVRDEGETYVRSTNGYIFVGAGTTTLSLFGPVHLPQGAVVTGASVLYQDNTDSGDFTEFDGRLRRRAIASSSNENIAVLQDAAPQSAASTDILSVEDNAPVTERATIDNNAYQYWMYVEATVDAPGNSNLRIYGFRVTYELDTLLP